MPFVLEISLKPHLFDAHGASVARKARDYFGIPADSARVVTVLTLDMDLSPDQLESIRTEIFTNPVTQVSSYKPLDIPFDWAIWVGFRPGVRDNPGATALEAIEDILAQKLPPKSRVYTSRRYCIEGKISREQANTIATQLLANELIQQVKIFSQKDWDSSTGIGIIAPKVLLDRKPVVTSIPMDSDESLLAVSQKRNLALNPNDIPTIRKYFQQKQVVTARRRVGLSQPTDVELEYISQARSDHCNHNTFNGKFFYREQGKPGVFEINSLFKTYIEKPTLEIKAKKPWVVSVLWDNAGVARFDENNCYTITGETHNSPSNMEAYGGAITGIVGVYRDPMGTGLGSKLIAGTWGFCVGPRDYDGPLTPKLHPRRLLDGIIEGVRDGGNKSGIPTPTGCLFFHPGYLGKCLVFVTALGIMPSKVGGKPSWEKATQKGQLVVMCGGRVGKDGIHGVTASSEVFSANTPAGHVQIGDPYTQKKMMDFLLEARDEGLIAFITDNGGGGLSSSVGESARFSGGVEIALDKVPLKYEGLDQWEIWISESQERMTLAIEQKNRARFMDLSAKHAVESTVIGSYTDSGKLHITWKGETCAFVDLSLLAEDFPQWEFEALWASPEQRGLSEPVLSFPEGSYTRLLCDMLNMPNLCSREWINRQYDHEVQGTSVIKPFVGVFADVPSDAGVLRPVLSSEKGIAIAQALLPGYSAIDTYAMTACVMDEAVRRVIAVGADPEQIGGVDNFCWPTIASDPKKNPDGPYKAAQLVRSCMALADICRAYGIPLLSGKDSMYVDGHLPGEYGERHKVSALPTLLFTTSAIVPDVKNCTTADFKMPGDLIYVLGITRNELGASQLYELLGHLGKNVPVVNPTENIALYRTLHKAINQGLCASVRGVYQGGLGVALAMSALAGDLGLFVDLAKVPREGNLHDLALLFSESAGRFVVSVSHENRHDFEAALAAFDVARIGTVSDTGDFAIRGLDRRNLVETNVDTLRAAWKQRFGGLI
ncbi:MAG: AIR synthase-related protein [Desulfatibacillaceae bacterium]|nr:AIR synthase-related protein [Desulfatibacillaceae bacterium]